MSVENKQVRGDASVSRNVNAGGNARVQGNMHVGHNLRVDGAVEARNIKAANKGLFWDEAQLKARYPQPEEGWFAGVGSSSPFVVYIARKDADGRVDWYATNGTFSVDVDMDSYNQRIDELESQLENNNALIAELIEIIREGGGSADLVMITIENDNPTWGSVSGGGLKRKGSVTVTATAENGYHFVEWRNENNEQVSTDAEYTFEATESVTLKAVFAVSYFTVTIGTDQTTLGDVSKSPSDASDGYIYNEEVTLTATPKQVVATAYFVRWEDAQGVMKSTRASYTFNVTENVTLKAVFAEVAAISTDIIGTGTGTIGVSIMRGETPVQDNTDVRIGDVITLTLTGTSNELSALVDGDDNDFIGEVTFDAATHTATYTFTYTGEESLVFEATFGGDAVIVSRTVSVNVKNGQSSWGSAEIVFDGESKSSVTVAENTDVLLRATANNGYAFAHWKKGVETLDWTAEKTLGVTESTAGTYTAEFEHNTAPDFYHGTNTASASQTLYNNADLATFVDGEWMDGANTKTTSAIPVAAGEKYIFLYNALHIKPTNVKYGEDLSDSDKYENFVESEITDDYFEIHDNVVINGIAYTSVEAIAPNSEGTSYLQVRFEKLSTNNS